jgi:hypothetical protein
VSEERKNNFLKKKKFKKNTSRNIRDTEINQEHKKVKEFKRKKQVYREDDEWLEDVDNYQ